MTWSTSVCLDANQDGTNHGDNEECMVFRVSENAACKMPIDNLATVFGPTVVGYSSPEPTMNHIMVQTKLQQLVNSLCICQADQFCASHAKQVPVNQLQRMAACLSCCRTLVCRRFSGCQLFPHPRLLQ